MPNVWKVGSRWSETGTWDSRIISVFRRSEVVFIGNKDTEKFNNEVKVGDYFAIADGYIIPAVAKAVSNPMPLNDMIQKKIVRVREEKFNITDDYDWCYGVKVKIVDLPKEKHLYYQKQGTFFKATSIAKKVIELYEDNLSHQFDIKANTYRISSQKKANNKEDDKLSIIDSNTFFIIPIYQRDYSWRKEQISRFIIDLFKGFWGSDEEKTIIKEPFFIGTMQLSYKKYIKENESEQDVIDGQQRLSTILCILKFLKIRYPHLENLKKIKLDWFETRVNKGKEDAYLQQMLSLTKFENIPQIEDSLLNPYLINIQTIKDVFEEQIIDDDGNELELFKNNIQSFVEYFLNNIYFVVVETCAGLSKTIQIFNTINTAGLDLNGNDLFKVRLYEYLHDYKNCGEEVFNEIGDIYKEIKDINSNWRKNHDWDVLTIGGVRSIYKNYLISKYKLRNSLYSKSTDSFFEELFDTLLNVQTHKDMTGVKNKNVDLSLDDLKRIIKVAYLWNSSEYPNEEDYISYTLIEKSRYSRYSDIVYQILLSNENKTDKERISQVYDCIKLLSRLFFCYSIWYARAVNEIHTFMYNHVYPQAVNYENCNKELLSIIQHKIDAWNEEWFRNNGLGKPLIKPIWKNLICILSDYLDEVEQKIPLESLKNLYNSDYDIEHIHATGNEEEGNDINENLQNSIGNLMMLEYNINRSIGKLPFKEKKERSDGRLSYKDSQFATVKKIKEKDSWGLQEIEERRKEEIDKIANYLFTPCSPTSPTPPTS